MFGRCLSQRPALWAKSLIAMSLSLHVGGCDEACVPAQATCEGNVVVACTSRGKNPKPSSTRRDCGSDVCVSTSDTAFCARDASPAPECASPDSQGAFCEGKDVVKCESGYAVTSETCSELHACVPLGPSNTPTCVESGSEGECPEGVEGGVCVGAEALRCSDGHVLARSSCAAPDLCHTPTSLTALCFVEGKPSCDATVRQPTQCIDNAPAWCERGVLVHGPRCTGSCEVTSDDGNATAECSP